MKHCHWAGSQRNVRRVWSINSKLMIFMFKWMKKKEKIKIKNVLFTLCYRFDVNRLLGPWYYALAIWLVSNKIGIALTNFFFYCESNECLMSLVVKCLFRWYEYQSCCHAARKRQHGHRKHSNWTKLTDWLTETQMEAINLNKKKTSVAEIRASFKTFLICN